MLGKRCVCEVVLPVAVGGVNDVSALEHGAVFGSAEETCTDDGCMTFEGVLGTEWQSEV